MRMTWLMAGFPFPTQVNVNVIEAQRLIGVNINPAVYVKVGDEKRHTATQKSTNCPFYNEASQFSSSLCALIVRCVDTTVWYFMTLFPPLHLQNFMFEFQETQAVLFDKVIEISVSRRVYKCVCKTRRVGVAHLNYVIWGHLNIFLCVSQIIVFAYSDSVLFFVLWTSRLSTKRP